METIFKESVRPKLELLNDLLDILGTHSDINLPCIVVVGTQSSGKSSVLERLARVHLPRGERLCTRAPLVLSMKKGEWMNPTISYENGGKVTTKSVELKSVAAAAKRAMDDLTKDAGKPITDQPIKLSVQGYSYPDLTLIDLPGIVYTELEGAVKGMIQKHVSNGAAIILCVLPATEDAEACETLKIARAFDPEGERTLGVITKVDRLENPRALQQKLCPDEASLSNLKLGLIAVRNPSTTGQSQAKNWKQADEDENAFFAHAVKDMHLAKGSYGLDMLAQRLCALQEENVTKRMPDMLKELQNKKQSYYESLMRISVPADVCESMRIFTKDVDTLKHLLRDLAKANHEELEQDSLELTERDKEVLRVCPRLHRIIDGLGKKLESLKPKVFSDAKLCEVRQELASVAGGHLPNFLPPDVFNALMRRWTSPYKIVVEKTLEEACGMALEVVQKSIKLIVHRNLFDLVWEAVEEGLNKRCDQAEEEVSVMLRQEFRVIQTNNSYYTETLKKIREQLANKAKGEEEEAMNTEALSELLDGDSGIAQDLRRKYQSHDADAMKELELQTSIFAYDKVVRKRLVDGLMQKARFALLTFFEDGERVLSQVLEDVAFNQKLIHARLSKQSFADSQRRQQLEQRFKKLSDAMERVGALSGFPSIQTTGSARGKRRRIGTT